MKTSEDFRRDYGQADEAFCRAIRQTLTELERKEDRPVRKIKWSVAIAAAALLTVMLGVAAALNNWGIMDFLKYVSNPDAKELVQQIEGCTVETDGATFNLKEAYYDGRGIYLVVNAKPKKEGVMLVPTDMDFDRRQSPYITGLGEMTVDEWKEKHGFTETVSAWVREDTTTPAKTMILTFSERYHLEEDGSLTILLSTVDMDLGDEDVTVYLTCYCKTGEAMEFAVSRNLFQEQSLVSAETVTYEELGVTVENVRLIATPMAVYYEIDYVSAQPIGTDNKGVVRMYDFSLADAHGNLLPASDVAWIAMSRPVDPERNQWRALGTISTNVELSQEVLMRCRQYDRSQKVAEETATVKLIKAE